ncbi:MAG: hypothetical protein ACE5NP_11925 [Anaerolineae bacterium]
MFAGQSTWIDVHNAFDPVQPVPPDKLDAWFVERPQSPLTVLLSDLHPEKVPKRAILVGHDASGKSTELTKLAAELAERYGYFVVRINLEQNLDIERANPVEVVFLMGAAIYKVAEAELERKPTRKPLETLKGDLETLVQTHTANKGFSIDLAELLGNLICFGASFLGGSSLGETVKTVAEKVIPPFRFVSGTNVEVVSRLEVEPQVERMVGHLNEVIEEVQEKAGRPLVLIVDGLDRPRDPNVIALNFSEKKFLASPACRVVYAAPIWLYYSPRFATVRNHFPTVLEFPNIKLYHKDDREQKDKKGYATMRQVAHKRLQDLDLEPNDVITPRALNLLIQGSGGVMRDFIRLVRDAATKAEIASKPRIDVLVAEKALSGLRRLYEAQLNPLHRQILAKVRETHQRTEEKECDDLLKGNFVLSYLNDEVWFDVHSILTS